MSNIDVDGASSVTVIGWDGSALSAAAQAALDAATLVVGGARHLEAATLPRDAQIITLGPLAPAVAALNAHDGPAVVLASGDPGFFGIVRALSEGGLEPPCLRVMPAISSVQAAFSRVGLAWDDAVVASMHGTSGGRDLRRAANLCRAYPKVALLTGPAKGRRGADSAQEIAAQEVAAQASAAQEMTRCTVAGDVGAECAELGDVAGGHAAAADGLSGRAMVEDAGGECARSGGVVPAQARQLAETEIAESRSQSQSQSPSSADATSAAHGVRELAAELIRTDIARPLPARTLIVAQRLGEADERVERLTLEQAASRFDFAEPNVVLCLAADSATSSPRWLAGRTGSGPDSGPWARPEAEFEHRGGQITKPEVRAQVLARLAPRPGDLIWDLGAGSGSVGIECARFGAAVVAVERDPDSCARILVNAAAHGASGAVSAVCGCAPEVLASLPQPDAVFVGGGGLEVLRAVLPSRPRSVVAAFAAVERVGEAVALLEADGREVGGVLLQASRLAALTGGVHRFAAQNPVFLVWGDDR